MDDSTIGGESKIRKVIFNEVTLIIAIVSLISGCIFWVSNPQNAMQIEIVELQAQVSNNETVTNALNELKNNDFHELQIKMDQIEDRQIDILQALAAINQQLLNQ